MSVSFKDLPADVLNMIPMEADVRSRMRGVNRDLRARLRDIDRSSYFVANSENDLFLYACRHGHVELAKYYLTYIGSNNINQTNIVENALEGQKMSITLLDMLYYYGIRSDPYIIVLAEYATDDWELNKDAFHWCEKKRGDLINYQHLLDIIVCNTDLAEYLFNKGATNVELLLHRAIKKHIDLTMVKWCISKGALPKEESLMKLRDIISRSTISTMWHLQDAQEILLFCGSKKKRKTKE